MPTNVAAFMSNLMANQWCHKVPEQTATFDNQTVIITGSNTGLGLDAARYIVSHNCAKLIIACRSIAKGEKAKETLEAETGRKGVVEVWALDLASYDSIKSFVAKAQGLERLDVLISNAGINTNKFELVNGLESMVAINVVSTFLHAMMMLSKLKESAAKYNTTPHLVIIASDVHWLDDLAAQRKDTSTPVLTQLADEKTAKMTDRYPVSKLLDVLLTFQLVKHLGENYPVIINTVNPGLCKSELQRDRPAALVSVMNVAMNARSGEEGARNYIAAASCGRELCGKYISEGKEGKLSPTVTSGVLDDVAVRIWDELCERVEKIAPGTVGRL